MGKNYKKFLIDLFESQIELNEAQEDYLEKRLFIEFNSGLGVEKFNTQNNNDDDFERYMRKSISKNCKMFLVSEKEVFYLYFNSIKTEISLTEYKRLNKKITHKRKKYLEDDIIKTNEKNEKLLNEVFSNFINKQERKTLIEKSND